MSTFHYYTIVDMVWCILESVNTHYKNTFNWAITTQKSYAQYNTPNTTQRINFNAVMWFKSELQDLDLR